RFPADEENRAHHERGERQQSEERDPVARNAPLDVLAGEPERLFDLRAGARGHGEECTTNEGAGGSSRLPPAPVRQFDDTVVWPPSPLASGVWRNQRKAGTSR